MGRVDHSWIILALLVLGCTSDKKEEPTEGFEADADTDTDADTDADTDTDTDTDADTGPAPCDVATRVIDVGTDTDGDGYSDEDEVHAGTDPTDPASVVYTGGWPYNQDKDAIVDPGWEIPGEDGATLPRFVGLDQYGQTVDIYDFANQGVTTVLDMSTEWCGPCNAVADWLGGDEDALLGYPWWKEEYRCIPDLVNKRQIQWITVLYEDGAHEDATLEVAQRWHESHPHDLIPVLVDEEKLLHAHIRATGIPNANLLTETMVFDGFDDRGLDGAFDTLVERYLE
jgi:hypothetical protein